MSLNTTIKKTDEKIAENLHEEYERWLIIGTRTGRISIIDLNTNQNALSFRAHDISIISLYPCITSFQPETLETNCSETRAEKARKYKGGLGISKSVGMEKLGILDDDADPTAAFALNDKNESQRSSNLRFSMSASDLHTIMTDQATNESYMKMGKFMFYAIYIGWYGNIAYWCFPLSQLQNQRIQCHRHRSLLWMQHQHLIRVAMAMRDKDRYHSHPVLLLNLIPYKLRLNPARHL